MRRRLAHTVISSTLGAVLLATAACSSDSSDDGLSPEAQEACDEYNRVINDWSNDYGTALATVGEAEAEANGEEDGEEEDGGDSGDSGPRDAAVEAVRSLFESAAGDLRTQAEAISEEDDLAAELNRAADGLDEIAGQIESYEDVSRAPELMAEGTFADGGQRVNEICAG